MRQIGLGDLNPVWKGKKSCNLTVTGETAHEEKMWRPRRRELMEWEKRTIIARTMETAVIVAMSTHQCCFDGKIFLQSSGGPIGMRATASLANVIMKVYDQCWRKLLRRENIVVDLFVRYVDDCRMFLSPISRITNTYS